VEGSRLFSGELEDWPVRERLAGNQQGVSWKSSGSYFRARFEHANNPQHYGSVSRINYIDAELHVPRSRAARDASTPVFSVNPLSKGYLLKVNANFGSSRLEPNDEFGTGEPCSITTGESVGDNVIPVRSYRSVVNAYVNNAESKFNGPDGNQCDPWTRGILQRTHVVAREHRYCGKEFKRKLEQGPVDHEVECKCKVYENGRVAADAETIRQLTRFSERQIRAGTGLRRDTIRSIRHGNGVKRATYQRVIDFLRSSAGRS
jgi:hypothetical protein